jgi:hypothetical protein
MRPVTVSSWIVGDGKVAGPHGTELVTLGLASEGRSQQARFNRGMCVALHAQPAPETLLNNAGSS